MNKPPTEPDAATLAAVTGALAQLREAQAVAADAAQSLEGLAAQLQPPRPPSLAARLIEFRERYRHYTTESHAGLSMQISYEDALRLLWLYEHARALRSLVRALDKAVADVNDQP